MIREGIDLTFELMSNGTLARLPQTSTPEGVVVPGGPHVTLLLPHNRYLLGRPVEGAESWTWGRPGEVSHGVFLYDGERLSLPQEGMPPISLPGETVTALKRELLAQMEPPGEHVAVDRMLRGLMKDRPAFAEDFPFQDEAAFVQCMNGDPALRGAYWALRFAMARGEFDEIARLKAWLKAGPDLLSAPAREDVPSARIWFSLLDEPDEPAVQELEALSFTREDLRHMVAQQRIPHLTHLILFNPRSGYLVLARPGRDNGVSGFLVWAFLPPALWTELRERRKLAVHELILALWGQYDVERALDERSRYAPMGDVHVEHAELVSLAHA